MQLSGFEVSEFRQSRANSTAGVMTGGTTWRMLGVVASLALLSILAVQVVEAQTNECLTTNNCATNAYCYNTQSSYYCYCRRGYYGDGTKTGSGCTRRKFATWRLVLSIIGAIIGAILLLCLCLTCLRNRYRRYPQENAAYPAQYPMQQTQYPMQTQGQPAYGYPAQGAPMYGTANKVPGPAGAV